jgi:hypothetical protein
MKPTVGFKHNVTMFLQEAIEIKGPRFESAYALFSEVHMARSFEYHMFELIRRTHLI